jgi:hypothetical protein
VFPEMYEMDFKYYLERNDRLCGLEFLVTDPEVRVRFPALSDFMRSSEPGTGSAQPREYN